MLSMDKFVLGRFFNGYEKIWGLSFNIFQMTEARSITLYTETDDYPKKIVQSELNVSMFERFYCNLLSVNFSIKFIA